MKFSISARLSLIVLVLLVASFAQAQFVSVGVTTATSTTATLNYTTAAPATTVVQYGTATFLGQVQAGETNILTITNKHTVVLIGLTPGTKYMFRIIATDLYGEPVVSNYKSFVTATGAGRKVSLNWQSPAGYSFNVYRGQVAGGPYTKLTPAPILDPMYDDASVVIGQTYYYVATAVGVSSQESAYSNEVPVSIQ